MFHAVFPGANNTSARTNSSSTTNRREDNTATQTFYNWVASHMPDFSTGSSNTSFPQDEMHIPGDFFVRQPTMPGTFEPEEVFETTSDSSSDELHPFEETFVSEVSKSINASTLNGLPKDMLDISKKAWLDEQSSDFVAASRKYSNLLKELISKHGEDSAQVAEVRAKLVSTLVKCGKDTEAGVQIGLLKQSVAQEYKPASKKVLKHFLQEAKHSKNATAIQRQERIKADVKVKKEFTATFEQMQLEQQEAQEREEAEKSKLDTAKAREAQHLKYASLAEDLKQLKLDQVINIGFDNQKHLERLFDEDDIKPIQEFNNGAKIPVGELSGDAGHIFNANIEDILSSSPKLYEVSPATGSAPVKIEEVASLPSSKILKHIIAFKTLKQLEMASNKEEEEFWQKRCKQWFKMSPSELKKEYPTNISLYDLFMQSDKKRGFESLTGMTDIKNYFVSNVISPFYDSYNTQNYHGVILHGQPGNGKTSITTAIAKHLGFNVYPIRRGSLETTFKNGVAETLSKTLKHARENQPSVVILEEADTLAAARDGIQSSDGAEAKETTALMNGIDQFNEENAQVLLLATTNFKDKLDTAFKREGRFHDEVEIFNPDIELREHLFKLYLDKLGIRDSEKLAKNAAPISEGLTAAAIRTICEFDLANDSNVKSRFLTNKQVTPQLSFEKLKSCIEKRKNKSETL